MNALSTLPRNIQSLPSVQSLAGRYELAQRQNSVMRKDAKNTVPTLEAVGATAVGAAISGVLQGKGFSETTIGMAGVGAVVAGLFLNQPTMVHAGNGVLCPVIAELSRKWTVGERVAA